MKKIQMAAKKLQYLLLTLVLLLPFKIIYPEQITAIEPQNETVEQENKIVVKTDLNNEIKKDQVKEEDKADLYLNFENANLSSVISYLGEQKKINIIPVKELDSLPVTLSTRHPLTLERGWNILLTLLDLNNYTMINVDNVYRIVKKEQNRAEPLPSYSSATGTEPENLPDTDVVIRYLYFLHNIKAGVIQPLLKDMLEGDVQDVKGLDAFLITDKCLNIKAVMKIITELDQGGLREAIKILPLEYADADEVAKLFNEQITPKDKQQRTIQFLGPTQKKPSTYFSNDTKIYPEARRNSLILLGTEKSLEKVIDFIKQFIDTPIHAAESRLHIKELKYARATELQKIIPQIIKPPEGTIKSLQAGQYKFFEDVTIAADYITSAEKDKEAIGGGGNRLIIACNKDDWKRLEKLIDKLDKPQPQVAFEVMVVDVEILEKNELWSQLKPKTANIIGMGVNAQFRNADANSGTVNVIQPLTDIGTNLTLGKALVDQKLSLWAAVKAILNKQNFNIITQPFIVTNNHKECYVDSTEERQVEGALDKTVGTQLARSKRSKQAKTKVTLTPHVNLDGIVDLHINVEISNFQKTAQTDPNTTERDLTTRVSMLAGEVLVLGGLTKDNVEEACYKTPILGDIPIIGNLFKSRKKTNKLNDLYIFVRPSIIKPRFEGVPDEYTQLKLDYAKYQILNADMYTKSKDPIQRWFFKPTDQSIKEKLTDARSGTLRPIDNYTYGVNQPKEVDLKIDPYYQGSEALEKEKAKLSQSGNDLKKRKLKSRHINA